MRNKEESARVTEEITNRISEIKEIINRNSDEHYQDQEEGTGDEE